MAKTTKSTKDVKPKTDDVPEVDDVVEKGTDVLADALESARDEGSEAVADSDVPVTGPESEPESELVEASPDGATENNDTDGPVAETEQTIAQAPKQKSGFMPVFLGGVVAAALGFGAARTDIFDPMLPESWKVAKTTEVNALSARVDDQTESVSALSGQVAGLAAPDITPLETEIATNTAAIAKLQTTIGSLSTDLAAVDARLTTLEKQPISQGVSQAAIDAYERELKDLQSSVASQRGEIESLLSDAKAMEHNAELTAQDALARAALTRVLSAIDSGAPFDAALGDLVSVTGATPPEDLSAVAAQGVTPLIQLQDQFPAVARAALAAARQDDPEAENGVLAFLSNQLGARSVAPREGSDPDAVLSRAEASLKEGRLNDTLAEIETLPPAAASALADWVAMAQARRSAQDAAEKLAQSLNSK